MRQTSLNSANRPKGLGGKIADQVNRLMNYFTLMSYVLTSSPKTSEASDKAWMRVLGEAIDGVAPLHTQILSTLTLLSTCLLSGQSLPPYLPLPRPYETIYHLLSIKPPAEPDNKLSTTQSILSRSSFPLEQSASYSTLRADSRRVDQPRGPRTEAVADEDVLEPEAWNLLDARNMEQQGYTEFAVLQVCSTLIIGELRGMIETVADLVGTVDFSFRVDRQSPSESETSFESMRRVGTWATRAATRGSGFNGNGAGGKGKSD